MQKQNDMKALKFFLIFIVTISLTSCKDNYLGETTIFTFPDEKWEKSNILTFIYTIPEVGEKYNIYVNLRHTSAFYDKKLKLKVTAISPSGKSDSFTEVLNIKNLRGKFKSECIGDYCDLKELIKKKYAFKETGEYKIQIEHLSDREFLSNVMRLELIVEKN